MISRIRVRVGAKILLEYWLVVLIDTDQLLLDVVVVRFINILQSVQVLEYIFDLL